MEQTLLKLSIMLVPGLLAVVLHEVAHGWTADRLGDPTARLLGRLTLNPLKHIDPIGLLLLLLVGFGWAKPVPVSVENLRHPRRDMAWVAFSGPATNLLLAVLAAGLLRGLGLWAVALPAGGLLAPVLEPLTLMVAFALYINLILALVNLLPVPPLDGGRVLAGLLPERAAAVLARVEPFGFMLVIVVLFFTPIWRQVLLPVASVLTAWLAGPQLPVVERTFSLLLRP